MADDIVTRLRVKDGVYTEFWQQKLMDEAADEIERLRAVLDAIDALHRRGILYTNASLATAICCECDYEWPCDTHMRLHGTEEATDGNRI